MLVGKWGFFGVSKHSDKKEKKSLKINPFSHKTKTKQNKTKPSFFNVYEMHMHLQASSLW